MKKRQIVAQLLVGLGSLNVLVGAGLHLLAGYPLLSKALAASNLGGILGNAMRAVFLIVGMAWITIAIVALIAACHSNAHSQGPCVVLRILAAGRDPDLGLVHGLVHRQ